LRNGSSNILLNAKKKNNKNSEIKTNNIFENLILDIESKFNLEKPTNRKELESGITYLTVFGKLMPNKTISISIILANKTFSHLLILENITKLIPVIDPFIYILNISSSRYTSDMFLDIIIDIGASRKSIAGYSQFQAL
jgi:hypothetical protein